MNIIRNIIADYEKLIKTNIQIPLSNNDIIKFSFNPQDLLHLLRLGALIIVKNFHEAQKVFEMLDDDQKLQMLDFPIYRLWIKPPCLPNMQPPDFNIYE